MRMSKLIVLATQSYYLDVFSIYLPCIILEEQGEHRSTAQHQPLVNSAYPHRLREFDASLRAGTSSVKNKYKRSDVNRIHQMSSQDAFETELASRPNPRPEALLALSLAYMYFKYRM
jgi:hypothetical protein